MKTLNYDVVVVGAGSAGSNTALHLAESGRKVALIEKGAVGQAGARWVNGVAPWMFERAGLGQPEPPERRSGGAPFHILDGDGLYGVTVASSPVIQVDMRRLVARLQARAKAAGVAFHPETRIERAVMEAGRLCAVEARLGGERVRFEAALFVDASGLAGALRAKVPDVNEWCPRPQRADVCSAGQQVRRIADEAGARAFLRRTGAASGDAVGFMGRDGGYSTLVVTVDLEAGSVDILTGAIALPEFQSGPQIIQSFVEEEGWIGETIFGGAGAIPLRRPYDCFVAPGLAMVGDAAAQVFPAHGSGVGTGLVAGRMLAEAVGRTGDPGGLEKLWTYQVRFMREIGYASAAYDVFRQLSQSLSREEVALLLRSGLMTPASSRAALLQQLPRTEMALLISTLRGAVRAPGLAARLAPTIFRMQAAARWYMRFPSRPGARSMRLWSRVAKRLVVMNSADSVESSEVRVVA